MLQFEIKNIDTFPEQIREVLTHGIEKLSDKEHIANEKFIYDYVDSNTWNEKNRGELRILYEDLWENLMQYSIVGYHNTRLLNPDSVYQKGLFFTEEKYFQQIENDMRMQGVQEKDIAYIVEQVKHEIDWRIVDGNMHRARTIDFVNSLETAKEYEMYLAPYGGECFERALCKGSSHEMARKYRKIITMGKPYSVKFAVPFVDFDDDAKNKIVRRILEYGLEYFIQNKQEDISDNFTICREIRAEEIVDVILNEMDFTPYYQYLFGEDKE